MEEFDDRQAEIDELKEKLSNLLNMVYSKDYIESLSKFRRYFVYFIFSIFMFCVLIYAVLKNILLLRWYKIRTQFYAVGQVDEIIKNHLGI